MTTSRTRPALNGVDTPALFATLDAVKASPELAKFQFRATNRWISGTHNRSTIRGFYGARLARIVTYGGDLDTARALLADLEPDGGRPTARSCWRGPRSSTSPATSTRPAKCRIGSGP